MYLNIKEIAEYLNLPESFIIEKIREGKIKFVSDGEQLLINKEQFNKHLELLEKKINDMKNEQEEVLQVDYDIKDED